LVIYVKIKGMKAKNIWIIILLGSILFGSCKKESKDAYEVEKVFPTSEEAFNDFKKSLVDGQSIWKGTLTPKSGKVYSLYIKLNDKGEMSMLADLDPQSGATAKTSKFSLRLEKTNPVIGFSEGSYLDSIYVRKGREIISADTSYSFSYKKADTIMLVGNRYGDELKLVYASVQERNDYNAGELGQSLYAVSWFFSKKPFYSVITSSGYGVQFAINQYSRSVIASYVDKDKVQTTSVDFAYGINRIQFKRPIKLGTNWVYEMFFDPVKEVFYIKDGTQKISFVGSNMPVIPLHQFLGNGFPSVLSIPSPYYVTELPGWSDYFYSIWTNATSELNYSPYQGFLLVVDFDFSTKTKVLNLNLYFDIGSQLYTATFPYSYTKTTDGTYKFTALPLNKNIEVQANAALIQPYVESILLAVSNNRYKLDYYDTPNGLLGQFISQDNPDIYFTGMIGSLVN